MAVKEAEDDDLGDEDDNDTKINVRLFVISRGEGQNLNKNQPIQKFNSNFFKSHCVCLVSLKILISQSYTLLNTHNTIGFLDCSIQ